DFRRGLEEHYASKPYAVTHIDDAKRGRHVTQLTGYSFGGADRSLQITAKAGLFTFGRRHGGSTYRRGGRGTNGMNNCPAVPMGCSHDGGRTTPIHSETRSASSGRRPLINAVRLKGRPARE